MMTLDDIDFAVLNAVFLRKMAMLPMLEECTGLASDEVRAAVDRAVGRGELLDMGGEYLLDDEGRRGVLAYYADAYQDIRSSPDVQKWYDRFETLNTRFLEATSSWQVGGEAGGGGDERALSSIAKAVERLVVALEQLADTVPRYRQYARRFTKALGKVDAGVAEYVTSPLVDSLHNIWFEFHEDILALLGRPRETLDE